MQHRRDVVANRDPRNVGRFGTLRRGGLHQWAADLVLGFLAALLRGFLAPVPQGHRGHAVAIAIAANLIAKRRIEDVIVRGQRHVNEAAAEFSVLAQHLQRSSGWKSHTVSRLTR